jgi:hypothetical protein
MASYTIASGRQEKIFRQTQIIELLRHVILNRYPDVRSPREVNASLNSQQLVNGRA